MDLSSFIKSRRFWLTAASIAATVLANNQLGLTPEQIQNIVLAIGAWVVGESLRSSQQSKPDANTPAA